MQNPNRTNVTELTSDELLLFDFLFDKTLAFHHLRMVDYSFHMNCPYSHGLDDQALQSTLTSLVVRGLIQHKTGPLWRIETRSYVKGDLYAMTEAGGKLWELERLPDWNRFLRTDHWQLGANSRGMMRIVCAEESTARMCIGAMFASGLISPIGRVRVRTIWNARLLPWKSFSRVQSIRCKTNDNVHDSTTATDWNVYNGMRCWWRDIHELESLNQGHR